MDLRMSDFVTAVMPEGRGAWAFIVPVFRNAINAW
jgi:hypothetical protein